MGGFIKVSRGKWMFKNGKNKTRDGFGNLKTMGDPRNVQK